MDSQLALMVNGPQKWYENLSKKFNTHGKTWLQQSKLLNDKHSKIFNEIIRKHGYFWTFGYVQKPVQKVNYLLHIDEIVFSKQRPQQRLSPPDNTAPDFDTYDMEQGKCQNEGDYKYKLWLRVVHLEKIDSLPLDKFIGYNKRLPLDQRYMKALHFYVNIPDEFQHLPLRQESVVSDLVSNDDYKPTADEDELSQRVTNLRRRGLIHVPRGIQAPQRVSSVSTAFVRDPQVKAWVLENAKGICEGCGQPAPFTLEDGTLFLEVHHVRPLAEGGSDKTLNAIALCPNCHRRCHLSSDRAAFAASIYKNINRLVPE